MWTFMIAPQQVQQTMPDIFFGLWRSNTTVAAGL
jgi:hypothetical protein